MQLNEYQQKALKTGDKNRTVREGLLWAALGLNGEAGEFADLIKKIFCEDKRDLTPEVCIQLRDELGDTLWYLSIATFYLSLQMGEAGCLTLDDVAHANNVKLAKRAAEKVIREHPHPQEPRILCTVCGEYHSMVHSEACKGEQQGEGDSWRQEDRFPEALVK